MYGDTSDNVAGSGSGSMTSPRLSAHRSAQTEYTMDEISQLIEWGSQELARQAGKLAASNRYVTRPFGLGQRRAMNNMHTAFFFLPVS